VNTISKLSLISFILIIPFFILTSFTSIIYAQEFEFNKEDYYDSENNPSNSEDADKENCIDNPMESVLSPNSDLSSDLYKSEVNFKKNLIWMENIIDLFFEHLN
jgi:hypothetical protein